MSEPTRFTIRRKIFTFPHVKFQVFDADGNLVATSRQKAFRLKEDIRLYRDEHCTQELMTIHARAMIDFSAAYDVFSATSGEKIGALRREGMKSILRDEWVVLDPEEHEIGRVKEDSMGLALVRRVLPPMFLPQKYELADGAGETLATFRTHFNPIVHKMTLEVFPNESIPNHLVLAAGLLLMAIEGRQG